MKVYISEIGQYNLHYRSDKVINLPAGTELKIENTTHVIIHSRGFTPFILSEATVTEYNLDSAIVWSPIIKMETEVSCFQ